MRIECVRVSGKNASDCAVEAVTLRCCACTGGLPDASFIQRIDVGCYNSSTCELCIDLSKLKLVKTRFYCSNNIAITLRSLTRCVYHVYSPAVGGWRGKGVEFTWLMTSSTFLFGVWERYCE